MIRSNMVDFDIEQKVNVTDFDLGDVTYLVISWTVEQLSFQKRNSKMTPCDVET